MRNSKKNELGVKKGSTQSCLPSLKKICPLHKNSIFLEIRVVRGWCNTRLKNTDTLLQPQMPKISKKKSKSIELLWSNDTNYAPKTQCSSEFRQKTI